MNPILADNGRRGYSHPETSTRTLDEVREQSFIFGRKKKKTSK